MADIINMPNSKVALSNEIGESTLTEIADGLLFDARAEIADQKTLSVPITQLATLGAGVSSLLPALRTVTQTTTINTTGLYQLANGAIEGALKVAKNGNFWGAYKTADGASKLAQLKSVGPLSASTQSVAAINPATMMMAVALFSIEQKLGEIEKMQKQIISFLEIEKESEIEADVETLTNIISKYKLNWDNEHFVASNHKLVLDIQRTARKNMNGYQKKVAEVLNSKKLVVVQNLVNSTLKDLQKKFKYYRLSLYTFSMASMMEIMLSGNFKEEYIAGIKDEIEKLSSVYRDLFGQCSLYLEKISEVSVESNVLKGIGTASKTFGKFIGNIPIMKEKQIDEFFQDSGKNINSNAKEIEKSAITAFAEISNPETRVFIDRMEDMIRIYNHTDRICFDDKKIYLITG
ncbi:MAG: hypothetical protein U0L20_01450 [Ruminococcus sp.]|nr:hypothetical protein [Ruminococcus sp.]